MSAPQVASFLLGITSALPAVRYDQEKISVGTISCCWFVRKAQECPYLGFLGERFVCTISGWSDVGKGQGWVYLAFLR